MKNVKVLKKFKDLVEGVDREIGSTFSVDDERADYLASYALVKIVETTDKETNINNDANADKSADTDKDADTDKVEKKTPPVKTTAQRRTTGKKTARKTSTTRKTTTRG